MADLPISDEVPEIPSGYVVGRYIVGVVDGADEDNEPDLIPARGTFEFEPSIGYIPHPLSATPFTLIKTTITGVLDDEGYLCTPDPVDPSLPGKRGIKLVATDAPGASVENWVWKVTPKFTGTAGRGVSILSFNIAVLANSVTDLSKTSKVPNSPGIGTEHAVALAASAQEAALTAEQFAVRSQEIAENAQNIANLARDLAFDLESRAEQGDFNGEMGPEGPQGIQGPKGDTGAASTVAGPQGPQGPKGDKGDKGDTGAASTVAGPAGPKGDKGDTGAASTVAGPAGPKGDKGDTGAASTVAGPKGEMGPEGPQGIQGPKGDTGAASTVAGPAGPKGDQGIQGPVGPKGDTGANGLSGKNLESFPWPRTTLLAPVKAGHTYTQGGVGTVAMENTSDGAISNMCISIVTDGKGSQGWIQSPTFAPVDMTNKGVLVWTKIENTADMAYIVLDVITGGNFSNRWRGYIMDPNGMLTSNDWVAVPVPWSNLLNVNGFGGGPVGTPDRTKVTGFRITTADKNGRPNVLKIGGIGSYDEAPNYPKGVVSFTFDDSFESTYTVGAAKLSEYAYRGTLFPIIGRLDQAGFLSMAQIRNLHDVRGWEIGAHASTVTSHTSYTNLTAQQISTEMVTIRNWQQQNGFESSSFAYPVGPYNQNAIEQVGRYYRSSRSNYNQVTTPVTMQPHRIAGMVLTPSLTLAAAKKRIDEVVAGGGWQPIVVHNLGPTLNGANEWTTENFNALVDYVASSGVAVETFGEVVSNKKSASSAVSTQRKNQVFSIRYVNNAWEYSTLAEAKANGLDESQTAWFVGGPSAPTWARSGDIFTQF